MVLHEDDVDPVTQEALARFKARRLIIEADEPPKLRVVDVLSHNDLVRGTYTHGDIYRIGLVRFALGHVLDVNVDKALNNPSAFKPIESMVATQPA